ncbi:MAG: GGDEF domain-containing protein [Planctomycetota bacterium]
MKPTIQQIVENDNIPSPPTVAARLLELVARPDSRMDEITKVLSADPKLSAKLIDYCNSPIVATKRETSSLQQAVTVLGMRTVRLLSLSFSLMDTRGGNGFPYEDFWRNSLAEAIAAKQLAKHLDRNPEEVFLLGLVFNIGLVGIGSVFAEEIDARFGENGILESLTTDVEREIAGASRYEIGGSLLEKWHFPDEMIEVLRNFDPCNLSAETEVYYVGQEIGGLLMSQKPDVRKISEARKTAEALLGMDNEKFDDLFDLMLEEWRGYENLFDFETIQFESIKELENRARESIMEISLGLERKVAEMTQQQEELRAMAMVDSLTRLKNRSAYDLEVEGILDLHRRHGRSFGMIVADIDNFKAFNDEYGHTAGDNVLKEVASCLDSHSRQYDTVYRFGGEEFAVVVADCDYEATERVCERLRSAVEALQVEYDGARLRVTASFGACWVEHGMLDKIESLFNQADANLYEAKRQGRNRCVCAKSTPVAALLN